MTGSSSSSSTTSPGNISVAGPVDLVLHWASPASPVDYLELPIPTLKVGALGTHNALGLAKAKGARFVLASTSEVYGDPLEHPQRESYWGNVNPIGPRGVYDEAKRFAEAITTAYHRYHGLDAKIVRIFNTYGPRMRLQDGRAIPNFITQALRGEDVTVYGNGEPDAQLLLHQRPGARDHRARGVRRQRTGQSWQPNRNDDSRDRRRHHLRDRLTFSRRADAAPHRRPEGAPAGHQPCANPAGMGAERVAGRGSGSDDRLLPGEAGYGRRTRVAPRYASQARCFRPSPRGLHGFAPQHFVALRSTAQPPGATHASLTRRATCRM